MEKHTYISLKDFTFINDFESSKYNILYKLKLCEKELNQSRLYPVYQILIDLYNQLSDILSNRNTIYNKEYSDNSVELEKDDNSVNLNSELEKSFELMNWGFKLISDILENGKEIYDFVDVNINIEPIGIISKHNSEGYFLLPDNKQRLLRIFKYSKVLYKVLKTKEVGSKYLPLISIPNEILKNHIIAEDILNQIIYFMNTELNFSYQHTILPVAKRKFISYLEGN
jgi:hypothetical protein